MHPVSVQSVEREAFDIGRQRRRAGDEDIAEIDGKSIGNHPGAGPMTRRLQSLYKDLVKENIS